jgi:DNA helicase II / ATP-dependent DNA helicase PcrA
MTGPNKVVIAAAGSGKTTFLVREALAIKSEWVLITTYTESNEAEIRQKFYDMNGHVPSNVVIMTWFSFLITHCVKPFQAPLISFLVNGMELVTSASGIKYRSNKGHPVFWTEDENFSRHYFNQRDEVYFDKLSKLVLRCHEKSNGSVFDRLSRVFPNIFVDEVQDLAGRDLDILVELFKTASRVLLVGDPRQVTYLTHLEKRLKKYRDGRIVDFLNDECPKTLQWELDETSLSRSHRNSGKICEISSKLFPAMKPSEPCDCETCRASTKVEPGLFLVNPNHVDAFLSKYSATQLRDKANIEGVRGACPALNFGISKGLGFDHILIFPTVPMLAWFQNVDATLKPTSRAKLYVALTRARHSVSVVTNKDTASFHSGFVQFAPVP